MRTHMILAAGTLAMFCAVALAAPPDAASDRTTLVKGNTAFAVDLYSRLSKEKGNLFFSPYSISTALTMTYSGARTRTALNMGAVLHLPREQERLHPACGALLRSINGDGKARGYQLSTANALWVQKDVGFQKEFLTTLQDNYGSGVREVDFSEHEKVRLDINGWAEMQTQGKIKDLLKPGILDPLTRFALTNAIYFKGDWVSQFKPKDTKEGDFRVAAEEKVRVPLMRQEGGFKYLKGETFQALELPYSGKDLSMVLFLPRQANGLPAFEQALTADNLAGWLTQLRPDLVKVTLPKFKITGEFRLDNVLSYMGMAGAFMPSQADFSGMTESKKLFLKAVVHKAFVEVNEEGTEAAAATVVTGGEESAPVVHNFQADHPFVFVIRDNRSGSILFLGRVVNPKES